MIDVIHQMVISYFVVITSLFLVYFRIIIRLSPRFFLLGAIIR